jgi:hypothetical protein
MLLELGGWEGTWRVEGPLALVERLSDVLESPHKDTIVTVYTNNMRVVAAIAMEVPITGDDKVDFEIFEMYASIEWATFQLAMQNPEATIPDAVWYVILGYRPSRQTDFLRRRPEVMDMLMVHDGRLWSLMCSDPHCPVPDHSAAGLPLAIPALAEIE